MHELKTELITFVNWACQCPLCACSPTLENIVRGAASTGCMVRAKIIRLNIPCWMWVLWPSWGGRIVFILIWACRAVPTEQHNCHFQNCPSFKTKPAQKQERSFVLLPCCASKRCLLSCMVGLTQRSVGSWATKGPSADYILALSLCRVHVPNKRWN